MFLYIFHLSKKYGVIVQNWGSHPQNTYMVDHTIITTYMPLVLDVCHDSILWHLRDVERVLPKHGAHLPPAAASPPTDLLPEPWESFASNVTGFPAHFEALYQCPFPLVHPPGAFSGVMEVRMTHVDPHLRHIHV
jgi:hypothetical protein